MKLLITETQTYIINLLLNNEKFYPHEQNPFFLIAICHTSIEHTGRCVNCMEDEKHPLCLQIDRRRDVDRCK